MPELPEVETIRRGLQANLVDDQVESVQVLRSQSIAHPAPRLLAQNLPGHKFLSIGRRGKYLIMSLTGDAALIVHLRMSGRLLLVPGNTVGGKFLRVRLKLISGRELHFEDMRVFGRVWFKNENELIADVVPALDLLGVEPLAQLTGAGLFKLLRNKSQAVKSAIMDQQLLAGIGNIYADESLFHARIHPQLQAKRVTRAQSERLVEEICRVLNRAIDLGGSSLRDYTDSQGVNGNYQHTACVYGRTGKPCQVCGRTIERMRISGRSAHFCRNCQRKT
jgi:formamidopyrimidine-DNA glycosylase